MVSFCGRPGGRVRRAPVPPHEFDPDELLAAAHHARRLQRHAFPGVWIQ